MLKPLKIIGIVGGGLLVMGGGAIATHLTYPSIEKRFFPERLDKESKMKESLKEADDEVRELGIQLIKQRKSSEQQHKKISSLNNDLKDLQITFDDKKQELSRKSSELEEKISQLRTKEEENNQQKLRITGLKSDLREKEDNFNRVTNEKTQIQNELGSIQDKLALTKKDILTDSALKLDSPGVNLRKIKWKSHEGDWSKFEVEGNDGTKTIFRLKKDHLPRHEEIAQLIRTKGITFSVFAQDFDLWDGSIKIIRFDVNYDSLITDPDQKDRYVDSNSKNERTIKISDYFKKEYQRDAFKVYLAIKQLDFLPIDYCVGDTNKSFSFRSDFKNNRDFFSSNSLTWKEFKGIGKFETWISRFRSIDDFIRYWSQKTVEYVRTGTVDVLEFMNPILLSKNYQ